MSQRLSTAQDNLFARRSDASGGSITNSGLNLSDATTQQAIDSLASRIAETPSNVSDVFVSQLSFFAPSVAALPAAYMPSNFPGRLIVIRAANRDYLAFSDGVAWTEEPLPREGSLTFIERFENEGIGNSGEGLYAGIDNGRFIIERSVSPLLITEELPADNGGHIFFKTPNGWYYWDNGYVRFNPLPATAPTQVIATAPSITWSEDPALATSTSLDISLTFTATVGEIDTATVDAAAITILAPDSTTLPVTLVGKAPAAGNAASITANFTAPVAAWQEGEYQIISNARVRDTSNQSVDGAVIYRSAVYEEKLIATLQSNSLAGEAVELQSKRTRYVWGDGTETIDNGNHTYTDGGANHTISIYACGSYKRLVTASTTIAILTLPDAANIEVLALAGSSHSVNDGFLAQVPNLGYLDVRSTGANFGDAGLANVPKLSYLDIRGTACNPTPTGLSALPRMSNYQDDGSAAALDSATIRSWPRLIALRTVNTLGSIDDSAFPNETKLVSLHIQNRDCSITDTALRNMPQMQILTIRQCDAVVTDLGLQSMSRLTRLVLTNMDARVSDAAISQMPNLTNLVLSGIEASQQQLDSIAIGLKSRRLDGTFNPSSLAVTINGSRPSNGTTLELSGTFDAPPATDPDYAALAAAYSERNGGATMPTGAGSGGKGAAWILREVFSHTIVV